MNEQQKEIIRKVAYNESLLEALKALFGEVIGGNNLLDEIDVNKPNDLVGEKAKIIKLADGMVYECFREIEKYKIDEKDTGQDENPGK